MTTNEYTIISKIITDAYTVFRYNQSNARDGDVSRSQHCAARFTTCGCILRHFGLDVRMGTWMDGDIEHISYMSIDGYRIVDNGEWDFDQYQQLGVHLREMASITED